MNRYLLILLCASWTQAQAMEDLNGKGQKAPSAAASVPSQSEQFQNEIKAISEWELFCENMGPDFKDNFVKLMLGGVNSETFDIRPQYKIDGLGYLSEKKFLFRNEDSLVGLLGVLFNICNVKGDEDAGKINADNIRTPFATPRQSVDFSVSVLSEETTKQKVLSFKSDYEALTKYKDLISKDKPELRTFDGIFRYVMETIYDQLNDYKDIKIKSKKYQDPQILLGKSGSKEIRLNPLSAIYSEKHTVVLGKIISTKRIASFLEENLKFFMSLSNKFEISSQKDFNKLHEDYNNLKKFFNSREKVMKLFSSKK